MGPCGLSTLATIDDSLSSTSSHPFNCVCMCVQQSNKQTKNNVHKLSFKRIQLRNSCSLHNWCRIICKFLWNDYDRKIFQKCLFYNFISQNYVAWLIESLSFSNCVLNTKLSFKKEKKSHRKESLVRSEWVGDVKMKMTLTIVIWLHDIYIYYINLFNHNLSIIYFW